MDEHLPLVAILRQDVEDLTDEERRIVVDAFRGGPVRWLRIDPKNYLEHDRMCQELKPDIVLLPKDRPIPAAAMERGVVHVAVVEGKLRKLLPLVPQFEDYTPPA